MRAAIYEAYGDPASVLRTAERPMPEPGPGLARVEMTRAAIHNHDLWTIRGRYGVKPPLPAIGGSEAAGVVDAVGEGVTNLRVGDRVAAFGLGTWAEYFLTSAAAAVRLPDAVPDEVGCQLVGMPLSAMQLLETYPVAPPDFIAQNAANGAVGKTLAVLAKARGRNVVNIVRSAAAVRELEQVGISGAIATDAPSFRDQVARTIGDGKVQCAIDSVGGDASNALAQLLAPGGKLVAFGSMSGEPMLIDSGYLIFRQITVEGFWMVRQNAVPQERAPAMIGELVRLVAEGVLKLPVADVFPIDRAAEALAASLRPSRDGKVLVRP